MSIVLLKPGAKRKGGLEKSFSLIASRLASSQKNVVWLTSGPHTPEIEGVHVETVAPLSSLSFLNLSRFDQGVTTWLKGKKPEIVFGFDRHSFQTHCRAGNGVHAAFLERRKKAEGFWKTLSFCFNPTHRLLLKMEKEGFENPALKKLFVNSQMVKEEILHHYKVDPKKIVVIYNGIDWQALETPFKESFNRSSSSPLQLLFVGHGYRRKGLKELLSALSLLSKEEWHLSVVGRDREERAYKKLAERLGIEEKVSFFGSQKEITPFYQLADFVIIPSQYDPFANVTIEALSMGVKVISSIHNGGHEILKEPYGFIAPDTYDPEAFASLLSKAFTTGKKTFPEAFATRQAASSFDLHRTVDILVQETLTDAT